MAHQSDEASVLVYRNVMVPMRDGARLATDIYFPSIDGVTPAAGRFPALVTRTPYSKTRLPGPDGAIGYGAPDLARRGYVVAVQDKRGRYGSEGVYPGIMQDDGWGTHQDGYDTIEWLARQDWCDGKVGAWGISYMGHTTFASAGAAPPHLVAGVPTQPANDIFSDERFIDGVFRIEVGGWTAMNGPDLISRLPAADQPQALAELEQFRLLGDRAYLILPVTDIPLQRRISGLWGEILQHRDDPDFFVETTVTPDRAAQVAVPLLHVGSWYDPFVRNNLRQFRLVSEGAADPEIRAAQRLIIGPWLHGGFANEQVGETRFPGSAIDYNALVAGWTDRWLRGRPAVEPDRHRVILYVMGANRWRAEPSWPVPGTTPTPFHLRAGGGMTVEAPEPGEAPGRFTYDPANPYTAPSAARGMNALNAFQLGSNVLVYTSAPLTEALEATGPVSATLHAASSATDTDWLVELHDVTPEGRSLIVTEGVCRARYRTSRTRPEALVPGRIERFEIDLHATSIVFKQGHRIRVVVTSGKFPYLERNPNAFVDLNSCTEADFVVAHQTIHHDAEHPSVITLPLVRIADHQDWIDNPAPPTRPAPVALVERAEADLA